MNSFRPLSVLFLSTGNAARGVLAEALLRHKGGDRFIARSAGYKPLHEIHPHTLALLASEGIAIDNLHTKGWSEYVGAARMLNFDVVVTLSGQAQANNPLWPNDPVRVHWTVDDPLSAEKPDIMEWKFRKCFNTLEVRIAALVKSKIAQSSSELLLQMKDIGMVV